jgi:hypothetical protein
MADIRIKDLTTEASASVTSDFLPIDGNTGTRKLSAFSPSFGGNVTVSGTLTASGSLVVSGKTTFGSSSSSAGTATIDSGGNYGLVLRGSTGAIADLTLTQDDGSIFLRNEVGTNNVVLPGIVKATGTTASTSSSTGALVVGNGTSGGLGVGGAGYFGGNVVGTQSIIARGNIGSPGSIGLTAFIDVDTVNSVSRVGSYNFTTSAWSELQINGGGGNVKVGNANTVLTVNGTTASTGTSSGALVVSGGVGVAKELYLGIKLNISTHDSSAGGIGFGTETNLYRYQAGGLALDHASGAAPGLLFRENGTSTLRLETNSGVGYLSTLTAANLILRTNATTALTLDTSQNAFFAGTIRTAAPSGGTAAAWKLGTVATVSPTSPNRTIEVDIGGTIYYIHAKTTNN